jgi:hypothetical protein
MRLIHADAALIAKYNSQHEREQDKAGKLIEDAPTVNGWISTNDRMPENDKDVLVWLYGDYCIGRYDQDPDNLHMRWKFESFNLYEDDMSYITHWMPLPEPPEKEK